MEVFFFFFKFLHRSNANVNRCRIRSELVGQFQGVGSGVFFPHTGDDESGKVLRGLNVETSTGGHLDGLATAGPLNVFGISREGTCYCQDFAWLNADIFRQSLNSGSRTWQATDYIAVLLRNNTQ